MATPDLQPLMSHVPLPVAGYDVPAEGSGYSVLTGVIRPLSRGRLQLRSADPAQAPVLDPCYLAEPADLSALVAAVRMTREIGSQHALAGWRGREVAPGPGVRTSEEFRGWITRTGGRDHSGDLRLGGRRLTAKRSCVHCGKLRLTRLYGLWEGSRPVVPGHRTARDD